MLILTRTPAEGEQAIHIGKDVIVTVLQVTGQTVSIGVSAPREVSVLREELLTESNSYKRSANTEC